MIVVRYVILDYGLITVIRPNADGPSAFGSVTQSAVLVSFTKLDETAPKAANHNTATRVDGQTRDSCILVSNALSYRDVTMRSCRIRLTALTVTPDLPLSWLRQLAILMLL